VNGAAGCRCWSRRRTSVTEYGTPDSSARIAFASASLAIAIFSPPFVANRATNGVSAPSGVSRASIDQYSCGTNASISRSRSQIRRTATDWTRPALKPPRTFRHSSGLSL